MARQLIAPVSRIFLTQRFGERPFFYKPMRGHNGLDFRTKFPDTPKGHCYVYPMAYGRVVEVGDQDVYIKGVRIRRVGYGKFVRVNHADGSQSVYGHLWKTYVKVGQTVDTDTIMALTDDTGRSSGSHLHVGYRPPNWLKNYNNGYYGYVDFQHLLKPRK